MRKSLAMLLLLHAFGYDPGYVGAEEARGTAMVLHSSPFAAQSSGTSAEGCSRKLVLCGQQFYSDLSTSDCKLDSGGYADFWSFPVFRAQAVAAAVSSSAIAPVIVLFNGADSPVDSDAVGVNGIGVVSHYSRGTDLYTVGIASTPTNATTGDYLVTILCDLGKCVPDQYTLCLASGRYRVQAAYENQFNGSLGFGKPLLKRTQSAGFFSFGDPSNVELLVKILDFGDAVKFFYGQLTDLKFQVTVTDMQTNKSETYKNTSGNCGGLDQKAFDTIGRQSVSVAAGCIPGNGRLCLLGKRFAATVSWRNQYDGTSGFGGAAPLSDLTGAFYFTDSSNLELMVKMIDFGDRVAVFYGTLSDLEYVLTVEDTATGKAKTYTNPAGRFCGGLDNSGF